MKTGYESADICLMNFLIRALKPCRLPAAIICGLLLASVVAGAAPVILNVSDAVTAGTSFNINGYQIIDRYVTGNNSPHQEIRPSLVVAVEFDAKGTSPATPDPTATYCSIMLSDKLAQSQFAIAQMPNVGKSGVFNCWVGDRLGSHVDWSAPVKINVARPLFISDYQTFSNGTIEVVGRNFDQREFNGQGITKARLNNGSGTVTNIAIKNYNPYHMTLLVSNQPAGTYYVEVSNDSGTNWSRTTSGQKLQVLPYPSGNFDPLGLNVSWAKDFNWGTVYTVTTTAPNDCTSEVQGVINSQASSGGGVIYFPAGSYNMSGISLSSRNVLEGAGQNQTTIYYTGANHAAWINSKGTGSYGGVAQLQGIANLTLKLSNPTDLTKRPDIFLNLGDNFSTRLDQTLRTANRLFVSNVGISYPYTNGDSVAGNGDRGIGLTFYAKERVLIQNCKWSGWYACMANSYLNNYCMARNNSFEYSTGYTANTANYLFMETNVVNIHPEYNQDSHGLDGRANSYMAGNYVSNSGNLSTTNSNGSLDNDGEGVFTEATITGYFNYGRVISATANSLTVACVVPFTNNPTVQYGALSVYITYGTGMGQMRPVASCVTNAAAANSGTITVSPAFTVTPDSTSIFTYYLPLNNVTYYANTISNCNKGYWFYDNQYDSVAANNVSINSAGIFVHSGRIGPTNVTSYAEDRADAYVRVCRNNVSGVNRRAKQGGIGLCTTRQDTINFYDTTIYGIEIVSNSVSGNSLLTPTSATEVPYYSGIYASAYPYGSLPFATGVGSGDTTDTIIEGNTLNNLQYGITVTKCNYGQYIDNNYFIPSVLNHMLNKTVTADNTVIAPGQ